VKLFSKNGTFQYYSFALIATIVIMASALLYGGGHVLLPIVALALIEITFSFENAVINSQVLGTMNRFWQRIFLTIGIAVAVFGVRLLLPLVLVSVTAHSGLGTVLNLALHNPDKYAEQLKAAYPVIAAFGGVFLLMIGLRFFGEKKDVTWLNKIEAPLAGFNQPWWVSISGAAIAIIILDTVLAHGQRRITVAGIFGALTFLAVKLVSELIEHTGRTNRKFSAGSAHHGLIQFIYLELLDASFSFDGVIAAFAITKEVILIAAGLGIGAMYVRSMTVHLLKKGTLTQYRYLVHGAHYAILALSLLLIASISHEIPEVITGLLGLAIITAAIISSIRYDRRQAVA
jgi:hypothetical protein